MKGYNKKFVLNIIWRGTVQNFITKKSLTAFCLVYSGGAVQIFTKTFCHEVMCLSHIWVIHKHKTLYDYIILICKYNFKKHSIHKQCTHRKYLQYCLTFRNIVYKLWHQTRALSDKKVRGPITYTTICDHLVLHQN